MIQAEASYMLTLTATDHSYGEEDDEDVTLLIHEMAKFHSPKLEVNMGSAISILLILDFEEKRMDFGDQHISGMIS
jgi:hypothetical protein